MYIEFDGFFGTTGVRGVRGLAVEASEATEGGLRLLCDCDTTLPTPSGTGLEVGGGKGDIEMLEIEAECAW